MNPTQGLISWASPRYPKSNMATVPNSVVVVVVVGVVVVVLVVVVVVVVVV